MSKRDCFWRLKALMAITIICLFASCMSEELPDTIDYIKVGDTVPQMEFEMSDGSMFNNDMLLGKTTVLVFFNTKCKDCQQELPIVQMLYERTANTNNIKIIAISRGEGYDIVKSYWQSHGLSIPYSAQEDEHLFHLFANQGIPRIYIIDADGKIKHAFSDSNLPSIQKLLTAIEG